MESEVKGVRIPIRWSSPKRRGGVCSEGTSAPFWPVQTPKNRASASVNGVYRPSVTAMRPTLRTQTRSPHVLTDSKRVNSRCAPTPRTALIDVPTAAICVRYKPPLVAKLNLSDGLGVQAVEAIRPNVSRSRRTAEVHARHQTGKCSSARCRPYSLVRTGVEDAPAGNNDGGNAMGCGHVFARSANGAGRRTANRRGDSLNRNIVRPPV